MEKLKCDYCGKPFGLFSKKKYITKYNTEKRVHMTFLLCDKCYKSMNK